MVPVSATKVICFFGKSLFIFKNQFGERIIAEKRDFPLIREQQIIEQKRGEREERRDKKEESLGDNGVDVSAIVFVPFYSQLWVADHSGSLFIFEINSLSQSQQEKEERREGETIVDDETMVMCVWKWIWKEGGGERGEERKENEKGLWVEESLEKENCVFWSWGGGSGERKGEEEEKEEEKNKKSLGVVDPITSLTVFSNDQVFIFLFLFLCCFNKKLPFFIFLFLQSTSKTDPLWNKKRKALVHQSNNKTN